MFSLFLVLYTRKVRVTLLVCTEYIDTPGSQQSTKQQPARQSGSKRAVLFLWFHIISLSFSLITRNPKPHSEYYYTINTTCCHPLFYYDRLLTNVPHSYCPLLLAATWLAFLLRPLLWVISWTNKNIHVVVTCDPVLLLYCCLHYLWEEWLWYQRVQSDMIRTMFVQPTNLPTVPWKSKQQTHKRGLKEKEVVLRCCSRESHRTVTSVLQYDFTVLQYSILLLVYCIYSSASNNCDTLLASSILGY